MRERIEKLLASDLSGYQIHKDNPLVPQERISSLRTGKIKLDNISFNLAEQLLKACDKYKI